MTQPVVNIMERPSIRCAGLTIRTSMEKAQADCSALWQNQFGPQMESFPADPAFPHQSFGVSVMLDSDTFDYWAVMPLAPGAEIPQGMDIFTIPGGMYAECAVPSLEKLGEIYTYIYSNWGQSQDKYALNMQGACYELYTIDFMKTGALMVYFPLVEK